MSNFDREAEREKLREQFAEDDDDRESTERMSELLLQGATMTNRHCDTCGDPVFRYDGREFCPTCQQPANGDGQAAPGEAGEPEPRPAAADDGDGAAGATGPTDGQPSPPATRDAEPPEPSGDRATRTGARETDRREPEAADGATTTPRSRPGEAGSGRSPAGDPAAAGEDARGSVPDRQGATDAGLGEARASLERTATRLARLAETSDDLGRTREYLAAAQEAAEALAAVKRASR